MTWSSALFTAFVRPRFSGSIGVVAIAGLVWWGASAYRLARQIEQRSPSVSSLSDAVQTSKDGEAYVRLTDATIDCSKALRWGFGQAVALVDSNGQVAAVAHLEECPARGAVLEGVFLDPPFGLYGEVVARGWDVTPGQLAFFEPDVRQSRAWSRIGVALVAIPLLVACFLAGVRAGEGRAQGEVWRLRALGFGLMAVSAWLQYHVREYVVLGVVPATGFVAAGFAVGLAFVVAPTTAFMRKVAARILPP